MPLDVQPDDVAMPYVCPWCGDRFARRYIAEGANLDTGSLQGHWAAAVECSTNRNTLSSMRPDAQTFGVPPTQPGQDTLDRIRRIDEDR